MKKKIIIAISIIIAVVLLFPSRTVLKDGGTVKYTALLYSITKYHRLAPMSSGSGYDEGISIKILGLEIFNNFKESHEQQNSNDVQNSNQTDNDTNNINSQNSNLQAMEGKVKNSFVGTILEETTTYMIVQPNEDEEERKEYEKIKVSYGTDHKDYLYGIGRKVIINYTEKIVPPTNKQIAENKEYDCIIEPYAHIITDDILINGYEDFKLSVKNSNKNKAVKILNNTELYKDYSDYNLYYYGLDEVNITIENKTMSLEEALRSGKMTLGGLIIKANKDYPDAEILKDGGSIEYHYPDYTIIKLHTVTGNRDIYIGSKSLQIEDCK